MKRVFFATLTLFSSMALANSGTVNDLPEPFYTCVETGVTDGYRHLSLMKDQFGQLSAQLSTQDINGPQVLATYLGVTVERIGGFIPEYIYSGNEDGNLSKSFTANLRIIGGRVTGKVQVFEYRNSDEFDVTCIMH